MTRHLIVPALMGSVMGLMLLRFLHTALSADGSASTAALIGFFAAHAAAVGLILVAGLLAARNAPRLQRQLSRLHRPTLRHVIAMCAAAVAAAGLAHLIVHGGF